MSGSVDPLADPDPGASESERSDASGTTSGSSIDAIMYGRGEGMEPDSSLAHMHLNLASYYKHPRAAKIRDKTAEEMTREEIAQAQTMARKWLEEREAN